MFSRRQFLQLAGVMLVGSQLPAPAIAANNSRFYGRALSAAPIYAHPDTTARPVRHLWPDSVSTMEEANAGWYRIDDGFVPQTAIQPVNLREPDLNTPASDFWAEVIAPVAPVDAPLATRIGHGGVSRVVDKLPDWYGIADAAGQMIGWSQSAHWSAINQQAGTAPLEIVIKSHHMTVYQRKRPILNAPITLNQPLSPGVFQLHRGEIGGVCCQTHTETFYHGGAWQLQFGGQQEITGVYWHNRFGETVPGPSVQVPPVLGRWLYEMAAENSTLTVAESA